MVGINMDEVTRDRVLKLMGEKDRIESEIRDQTAILESNNIDMDEPLVDVDGFPRNDIDVYKVRHARHRIICLQNDHKNIMKMIERGLTEVHSGLLGTNPSPGTPSEAPTTSTNGNAPAVLDSGDSHIEEKPFAFVSFVDQDSPADLGGLTTQDEILQFGSVNHVNFKDITQINQIVAHSVMQSINVKVRRNQHVINLTIVPRPWARPGLLGCHIQSL